MSRLKARRVQRKPRIHSVAVVLHLAKCLRLRRVLRRSLVATVEKRTMGVHPKSGKSCPAFSKKCDNCDWLAIFKKMFI